MYKWINVSLQESELKECSARLAHAEDVSERRKLLIESMEVKYQKLEMALHNAHKVLVSKDNTHTVQTHERDVLLRELSHQLFESREIADVLKKKLKRNNQCSPLSPKFRAVNKMVLYLLYSNSHRRAYYLNYTPTGVRCKDSDIGAR
jgi:predicted RNase H-like nuclease (RuvC/YqgF family)